MNEKMGMETGNRDNVINFPVGQANRDAGQQEPGVRREGPPEILPFERLCEVAEDIISRNIEPADVTPRMNLKPKESKVDATKLSDQTLKEFLTDNGNSDTPAMFNVALEFLRRRDAGVLK